VAVALAFSPRPPLVHASTPFKFLRGGKVSAETAVKDFRGEATNKFNNLRTPAALIAGASLGACFALQPAAGDALPVAIAKRGHLLLGVVAFSAELISVLVSSLTIGQLGSGSASGAEHADVAAFMDAEYELEWITTEFNFLVGLLGFTCMLGLRAWVAFSCPLFAKIAAGIVTSAVLLMLSFTQDSTKHFSLPSMGLRYFTLILAKAWAQKSLLLFAALAVGGTSLGGLAKALYIMGTGNM